MRRKTLLQLEGLAKRLEGSQVDLPVSLKLRAAELILDLMARRKHFGLFVIVGWEGKWREYLDISDSRQDIFTDRPADIMRVGSGKRVWRDLTSTVDFDGAILIDRRGTIVHSGVMIEGMRPRIVARRLNPGRFTDLSEQFGFKTKVHTRHLTAITASYAFKGTTVFTVSEEDGSFHAFEAGRIVHQGR